MENFVLYDEIAVSDEQTIYKARRKGTISFLAISSIDKRKRAYVTNHVRFAHEFNHQNILRFYEWYETSNHLWVVMDLCTGGTLENVLREDKILPEEAIIRFGRQLVQGLSFMHLSGAIFGDWCPRRIFLDGEGNIKYYDFSYARMENECGQKFLRRFSDENDESDSEFDGLSYSALPYISPEVLSGQPTSKASDVWGLGCLLYQMFAGSTPYASQVSSHLIQMILNNELRLPSQFARQPSSSLWHLLSSMLTKDPSQRMTLAEVLDHKFWLGSKETTPEDANPNLNNGFDVASLTGSDVSICSVIPANSKQLAANTMNQAKTLATKPTRRNSKTADKRPALTSQSSAKEKENAPPSKLEMPTASATFSLHAQSCPITMRREPVKAAAEGSDNTVVNSSNNSDSMDQSGCESVHRLSKVSTTSESDQTFKSEDGLNTSIQSPLSMEHRMTKSEFTFREDDKNANSVAKLYSASSISVGLGTPQTRSRLALIYPWGDKSASLPQEVDIVHLSSPSQLEDVFRNEIDQPSTDFLQNETAAVTERPFWCPQPLSDYEKWAQHSPHTSSRADSRLLGNAMIFSPTHIASLTLPEIEEHFQVVLRLLNGGPEEKTKLAGRLAYLTWFTSTTTLLYSKTAQKNSNYFSLISSSISRAHTLLEEAVRLLRQPTATTNSEARTWLCRLIGLLAHRTAYLLLWLSGEHEHLMRQLTACLAPDIPACLAIIVEVLREPATRSLTHLRQAGVTALGELIVCEICIAGAVLNTRMDTKSWGDLNPVHFDIQQGQWQSITFQLVRCLSTSKALSASQQQMASPAVYCNTLTAIPDDNTGKASDLATVSIPTGSQLTEDHVRLAAARALDEMVTAVLGCNLHHLLQRMNASDVDRSQPGIAVMFTLSTSIFTFLDCILTPETVSRLWADGVLGGLSEGTGIGGSNATGPSNVGGRLSSANISSQNPRVKTQVCQRVAFTSSSALAGLIRLRPALFTGGLIDRNGTSAFLSKFNPSVGNREPHHTAFTARLLSATANGLLLPLSLRVKPLSTSFLLVGMKAGTPAACRRLLSSRRFISSLVRHLESPHVMLRAKAYLLAAAALDISPGGVLPTACDSRLPSCLERDLRMTNQHNPQALPSMTPMSTTTATVTEIDVSTDEPAAMQMNLVRSHRTPSVIHAPDLQYLGFCCRHLADFLIEHLVPKVCEQVAISIGVLRLPKSSSQQKLSSAAGTSLRSNIRSAKPHCAIRRPSVTTPGGAAHTASLGVSLRTWLPAYSCIPAILASSLSVRSGLLLPPADRPVNRFCLVVFIGKLLEHWTSNDPVTAAASISGVHQPGSLENQVLLTTLAIIEDMSQLEDLVETRRSDLLKHILPGLANLAIAPASSPETRATCVKIIFDLRNRWLGESDSMYTSNISLNIGKTTPRPYQPSENSCLTPSPRGSGPRSLCGSTRSGRLASRPNNRPTSFYVKGSSKGEAQRYRVTPTQKGIQGPSPEVLLEVMDIVKRLVVPEAHHLLDPREPAPATYFLQLMLDTLTHLPSAHPFPPQSSLCAFPSSSPTRFPVNMFVQKWTASGLSSSLLDLLTQVLSSARVCDPLSTSPDASARFSRPTTSPTVTPLSNLCLLAVRLFTVLVRFPQDINLLSLISPLPNDSDPSLIQVTGKLTVTLGGLILRRARREPSAPAKSSASASSAKIRGTLPVLRVSSSTPGMSQLLATLMLINAQLSFIADVVRYALTCRQQKAVNGCPISQEPPSSARSHCNQPTAEELANVIACLPSDLDNICVVAEQVRNRCPFLKSYVSKSTNKG
uniref:Protein kinase domain-containing protein n=1 Tax=Schistocephalus solidus TaxID=70667 RepID=A0A0V0JBP8_SCHSO